MTNMFAHFLSAPLEQNHDQNNIELPSSWKIPSQSFFHFTSKCDVWLEQGSNKKYENGESLQNRPHVLLLLLYEVMTGEIKIMPEPVILSDVLLRLLKALF